MANKPALHAIFMRVRIQDLKISLVHEIVVLLHLLDPTISLALQITLLCSLLILATKIRK